MTILKQDTLYAGNGLPKWEGENPTRHKWDKVHFVAPNSAWAKNRAIMFLSYMERTVVRNELSFLLLTFHHYISVYYLSLITLSFTVELLMMLRIFLYFWPVFKHHLWIVKAKISSLPFLIFYLPPLFSYLPPLPVLLTVL